MGALGLPPGHIRNATCREPLVPLFYESSDLRFQYPDNWKVVHQQAGWPREVTIESPGGAMWSVHLVRGREQRDRLVAEMVRSLEAEYPQLEVDPLESRLPEELAPVGCEASFFYLDLLVRSVIECFYWGDLTVLIVSQAEDRDHQRLELVFHAVLTSLLRESHWQTGEG